MTSDDRATTRTGYRKTDGTQSFATVPTMPRRYEIGEDTTSGETVLLGKTYGVNGWTEVRPA